MARTDSLTNFLTDVSTAIKTKKGDDTPIKASNFDTEIANLPSGGGDIEEYMSTEYMEDGRSLGGGYWTKLIKKLRPITNLPAKCDYFFQGYSGEKPDFSQLPSDLKITSAKNMFYNYQSDEVDLTNLDLNNATDVSNIFANFRGTKIIWGDNKFSSATNVSYMFAFITELGNIPFENFDFAKVTNTSYFAQNNTVITNINFTVASGQMHYSFAGCTNLENIKISNPRCAALTNTFSGDTKLKTIDMSGTSFPNLTGTNSFGAYNFVNNCSALENLTFGTDYGAGFKTTLTANGAYAHLDFSSCPLLTKESVLDVFNKVADLTEKNTQKITLHADVLAQLTEEEIAIATNKNWTVA